MIGDDDAEDDHDDDMRRVSDTLGNLASYDLLPPE